MSISSTHLSTHSEGRIAEETAVRQVELDQIQELQALAPRTHLQDVINFHEHFELHHEVQEKPSFLPMDLQKVRVNFLQEELNEYAAACGLEQIIGEPDETGEVPITWDFRQPTASENKTNFIITGMTGQEALEKALDGLIDLQYVLLGTVHLHGFADIWQSAWSRVQDANMSKVRVTNAGDSKRGTTHDVLKPEGWIAPQFRDLLFY